MAHSNLPWPLWIWQDLPSGYFQCLLKIFWILLVFASHCSGYYYPQLTIQKPLLAIHVPDPAVSISIAEYCKTSVNYCYMCYILDTVCYRCCYLLAGYHSGYCQCYVAISCDTASVAGYQSRYWQRYHSKFWILLTFAISLDISSQPSVWILLFAIILDTACVCQLLWIL